MFYLYILKNAKSKRHYIGITGNIEKRLQKHNNGEVRSTKAYKPWEVSLTEEYPDRYSARKRELFLKKTAVARNAIFNRLDQMAPSSNG